jgi:hypothetical protein
MTSNSSLAIHDSLNQITGVNIMSSEKFALVSALLPSRLDDSKDIGGWYPCVRIFDNRITALSFAVELITTHRPGNPLRAVDREPRDILNDFQDSLKEGEVFHLFPIVA